MIHGWSAMVRTTRDWEAELRGWLEPFLERLGHKARRRMCPLYVAGLIGPGDRKSVQPMAERLAPNDYDQLHHFIAGGVWDTAPLERELLIHADRLVGGSDAVLVINRRHRGAQERQAFGKSEAEKKNQRTATSTDVARRPARHRRSHHAIKPSAMSVLPNLDRHAAAA
jgi:DDE superfamily endonuclease